MFAGTLIAPSSEKAGSFGMMVPTRMDGIMGGSMRETMGSDATDETFLRTMIPHHQLAMKMSEQALKEAEHPELRDLARQIVAEQAADTELMRGYLKEIEDEQHR